MKKRNVLLMIFMIGVFLFVENVKAEEDMSCNAISLNELRTAAANIKISYVPGVKTVKGEPDPEYNDPIEEEYNYLDIKIYNLTDKLYVSAEATGNKVNAQEDLVFSSRDRGSDGAVTIRQLSENELITYTFTVLSDEYGCSSKVLRTIKLTLPRFNWYSRLAVCEDIPDYYLCQDYTTYQIDGSTFYDKVDEYKAKLLAQEEDKNGIDLDDNTGIISKTVSTVSKNKYVIAGVLVIVGVAATVYILKRKKSDL